MFCRTIVSAEAFDRSKDVIGRLGPSERFGIGFVSVDERSDVSPEGGDAAIDAALDLLIGEELKLFHRRSAGRGLIIVLAIIAETLEWNADEFSGASRKFCAPVEYFAVGPNSDYGRALVRERKYTARGRLRTPSPCALPITGQGELKDSAAGDVRARGQLPAMIFDDGTADR